MNIRSYILSYQNVIVNLYFFEILLSKCLSMFKKNIRFCILVLTIYIPASGFGQKSVVYSEVIIGTQTWMSKNLDVSIFRNGDPIPEARTSEEWKRASDNKQPSWCYYDNKPANGTIYGVPRRFK